MGSLTDYSEQALLDHAVGKASYTPVATLYLALCTADPTDSATGASMNEVSDSNAYQRTAVSFGAAASRAVTQDSDTVFPQATGSWGTVTHWAVVDTQTYGSGNVLAHGAFSTSKDINTDNTATVPSGEVEVSFNAGELSDYLANNLLDLMYNDVAFSSPATWIALWTSTLSDSDGGGAAGEVSGGAYSRQQVGTASWDSATGTNPAYVDNNALIDFGTATAGWGTVVAVAVLDASASGNLLWYDNDVTDQQVSTNDSVEIASSDLTLQMS